MYKEEQMSNRTLWALISLAAGLLIQTESRVAQAADPNKAEVLYQKGNAAYREGDDVMAREHYKASIAEAETFSAVCNLGVSEARSNLLTDAYEHLLLCLYLYPQDKEFVEQKQKFTALRNKVREQITFEEAYPIDKKVEAEIKRREKGEEQAVGPEAREAKDEAPASSDPEPAREPSRSSARVPVSVSVGVVGLVGVGVGTALLVASGSKSKKAEEVDGRLEADNVSCSDPSVDPRCGELADNLEKSDNLHNVGLPVLIGGGVATMGAVVLFLVWPEPKGEAAMSPHLRPMVGGLESPGFQLGISGRF